MTKRALVIDDHPITHLGASRLLRDLGYDPVGQAMSGEEALDQLTRDAAPDLIVLDISLPGAGGLDLVTPLLAAAPDARILVFSMNDQTGFAARACRRARRGFCPRTRPHPIFATPSARWRPESSIWPPSRRWRWPRCARARRATRWARCRTANARCWP
ncbi:response regulator transcription factor [Paracoccus sp. PAMC 22219]|uniref:response regulator n=1 Tax=Paracoccus sp. PAMC 22219 TaxID=1569209 RepID=UPI000696D774|nr:response regulator transcription factor [Paracoccus sp. PAMC 22219]